MQKLNLLTYADELYLPMQRKLVDHALSLKVFDYIFSPNREHLISTPFYRKNKYILDKRRGNGYCCWKPYYILETLMTMNDGDILLYLDSADWLEGMPINESCSGLGLRCSITREMADKDILLTAGAFPQKDWTKRDCFYFMGCDEEKYWNAIQIEAGIILIKKSPAIIKILEEWQNWCCDSVIITEDENVCGLPNLDGFREHRYDQSVLQNLSTKYNLPVSDFMRKFARCNVNMPE